jgi:hypothetical protein
MLGRELIKSLADVYFAPKSGRKADVLDRLLSART